jgi:hypothetical protein
LHRHNIRRNFVEDHRKRGWLSWKINNQMENKSENFEVYVISFPDMNSNLILIITYSVGLNVVNNILIPSPRHDIYLSFGRNLQNYVQRPTEGIMSVKSCNRCGVNTAAYFRKHRSGAAVFRAGSVSWVISHIIDTDVLFLKNFYPNIVCNIKE